MHAPNHPEVISRASVRPVHLMLPPPQLHPVNHRLLEGPVSNQSLSNYYFSSALTRASAEEPGAMFPFIMLPPRSGARCSFIKDGVLK